MAKTKATDILSLIEAEHRQVKKLFAEAEKAKLVPDIEAALAM